MIQRKVAVEKITSTGSSTSSLRTSRCSTRTLGSPSKRFRAASTMYSEASTASTVPHGRCRKRSSVTLPVPHPTSMVASSPLKPRRSRKIPRKSAPQPVCGPETDSYSAESHSSGKLPHPPCFVSYNETKCLPYGQYRRDFRGEQGHECERGWGLRQVGRDSLLPLRGWSGDAGGGGRWDGVIASDGAPAIVGAGGAPPGGSERRAVLARRAASGMGEQGYGPGSRRGGPTCAGGSQRRDRGEHAALREGGRSPGERRLRRAGGRGLERHRPGRRGAAAGSWLRRESAPRLGRGWEEVIQLEYGGGSGAGMG